MKPLPLAFAALVSLSATALCDDPPVPAPTPPADGAKPDAPKPEPKKERKVDPAAMKLFEKYVSMLHLPANAGLKSVAAKGEIEGKKIHIDPSWTAADGYDVNVTLDEVPEELKQILVSQGVPEEAVEAVAPQVVQMQVGMAGINAAFEAPGRGWEHFDIALAQAGEDQVITLTACDEQADADRRIYTFGKDGILKSSVMEPSGNNPQGERLKAMGVTFESSSTFEKVGERYILKGRALSVMGQDTDTKFSYYDGPNGSFLLKAVEISSLQGTESISFHDYTVDGKLVEATKPAKKAEEPKSDAAKPADPVPAPKVDPK